MPNFVNNTLTVQGEGQVAASMAGQQMVITRVQVGSGVTNSPLASMTALVAPVMNLTPQPPNVSANNLQNGEIIIMVILDSANVASPFNLTELGVWAAVGGGSEQLIAYCQASSPYDNIAPGSGSGRLQVNLQVPMIVGVGANVSVTVAPGSAAYVPPVVAGPGIVVTAPLDNLGRVIEWIVSTPQITQNTTLYVANEYTQNNPPYFSTIQNAMNYLGTFTIAAGVAITINVAPETFTIGQGQTQIINHPNGQQITIQGVLYPSTNFTSVGTITGSNGNWAVPLKGVGSTANITPGSWVIIWNTGPGIFGAQLCGMCKVTAVSGNTVTVQNVLSFQTPNTPSQSGTSGTIQPLGTILNVTDKHGTGGILIEGAGVGMLQNIGIVGSGVNANYEAAGLEVYAGYAYLKCIGVYGFQGAAGSSAGILTDFGAQTDAEQCGCTYNDNGFDGDGSLVLVNSVSTNNTVNGIWMYWGGQVWTEPDNNFNDSYTMVAGNVKLGIFISDGSEFVLGTSVGLGKKGSGHMELVDNNGDGINIVNMSRGTITSGPVLYVQNNYGNYDVYLATLSYFNGSSYINGGPVFNTTLGVLSSDGCLRR